MRRLSLSELKEKQLKLQEKITAAENREKIRIADYIKEITGEDELENVKKWIDENIVNYKEGTAEKNERLELHK